LKINDLLVTMPCGDRHPDRHRCGKLIARQMAILQSPCSPGRVTMMTMGDDSLYPIVTSITLSQQRLFGVGDDGDDHFLYVRGKKYLHFFRCLLSLWGDKKEAASQGGLDGLRM
jgi:hypothetical protein